MHSLHVEVFELLSDVLSDIFDFAFFYLLRAKKLEGHQDLSTFLYMWDSKYGFKNNVFEKG